MTDEEWDEIIDYEASKTAESVKAYKRAWYHKNKEKSLARAKTWREANPELAKQRRKAWEKENPDKLRIYHKVANWKRLGIKDVSHEKYLALLEQQGGVCALCKQPPKESRKLAWDHHHMTGKGRGLLCGSCNIRLGWVEKFLLDEQWASKAKAYLDQWT